MTRTLTITALEWASAKDGTLWLVGQGGEHWAMRPDAPVLLGHLPPAEFVLACAPCETCGDERMTTYSVFFHTPEWEQGRACPDCRIKLVGVCPTCAGDTNDEFHPCAKSQRDGQHCNCSMEQDHCHWCGLEWLGDGEIDCPQCKNTKTVTLGHAYAVGQPLPIMDGDVVQVGPPPPDSLFVATFEDSVHVVHDADYMNEGITAALAHYGPPEALIGKWALQLVATT